jgi:CheY-like chemotaxis protein
VNQRWNTTYGITRVRACCLFRWFERGGAPRTLELRPEHCAACTAEVRATAEERGFRLIVRGSIRHTILIIDDDVEIRTALVSVLQDEGYFAYQAANGVEALTLLGQIPRPSAVLVDLMMPELDGWQLIPSLRAQGLPVIVITATKAEGVEGVGEIMHKPISIDRLVTTIERLAA